MPLNADWLVLHQALHGYCDGHRLLACSRPLPRDAQRIMLALSDAAGSGIPEGFDSYLTAYPLRSAGAFALARTWSAPEMPRPGCVWTHTLLIDVGDLTRLDSVATLPALFRRPTSGSDGYDSPLRAASSAGLRLDEWSRALAARVVEALYAARSDGPVVVAADRSEDVEALFLALWDQQWTEQRSTFTLSTGSIAPRSLDGIPFRLQAAPAADAHRLWRKANATVIEFNVKPKASIEVPEWARAASDALGDEAAALRTFVRDFGRHLPGDPAYFRPLVLAYLGCNRYDGPPLVRSLIDTAAGAFPAADQGIALKVALFGRPADSDTPQIPATEEDVVSTLAASDHAEAFPPDTLSIENRAEDWWVGRRDFAAVARITECPSAPLREAFLTGVARALSVSDIHRFLEKHRPADAAVIVRRAEFANRPDHWRCPPDLQVRLAQIVSGAPDRLGGDMPSVIRASLAAHADAAAPALSTAADDQVVSVVMTWLGQTGDIDGVGPLWRAELAARAGQVVAWLSSEENPRPWPIWLASTLIHPDSLVIQGDGAELWPQLLSRSEGLPAWARRQFDAYVLGVGLLDANDLSFPAVSATFGPVHRAAQADVLDDLGWGYVSPRLPAAPWWREWDRCGRLRRGIVERFVGQRWSPHLLFELGRDAAVFTELVGEFRDSRDGRRFLRAIARAVEDGTVTVPPDRFELIS